MALFGSVREYAYYLIERSGGFGPASGNSADNPNKPGLSATGPCGAGGMTIAVIDQFW
jgi:hypothetical protein